MNQQIYDFIKKDEERPATMKTVDSSIFADFRKFAIAEKEDKAELVKLEQFCDTYDVSTIVDFMNRHRREFDQYKDFFERCIKHANLAKVGPLKLLLSGAMIFGNPLFNAIPKIILEAQEELRSELV